MFQVSFCRMGKVIRFLLVGIVNTAVSYLSFLCIYYFTNVYLLSSALGYLFAVSFSYILNKCWVFKNKREMNPSEVGYFILANIISLVVSLLVLLLSVELLGFSPYLAQLIATAGIMLTNFVGYRFIFK